MTTAQPLTPVDETTGLWPSEAPESGSVYVYLCSGDVVQVDNARSIELTDDVLRVLRARRQKPVVIARARVYFCSRFREAPPVQF